MTPPNLVWSFEKFVNSPFKETWPSTYFVQRILHNQEKIGYFLPRPTKYRLNVQSMSLPLLIGRPDTYADKFVSTCFLPVQQSCFPQNEYPMKIIPQMKMNCRGMQAWEMVLVFKKDLPRTVSGLFILCSRLIPEQPAVSGQRF